MKQIAIEFQEPTIAELDKQLWVVNDKILYCEKQRMKALKKYDTENIDKYDSLIEGHKEKFNAIIDKIISLLKRKP